MTTGKTIALTRQTFVGKVMALLFNKLSMLGRAFLFKEQADSWRGLFSVFFDLFLLLEPMSW